jgi:endoglycosylceramidase
VAGRLDDYRFDFATRTLDVTLQPDAKLGGTGLFVSADRFYPAGFRVEIGEGLVMELKAADGELQVVRSARESDRSQAGLVRWDGKNLHLVIGKWVEDTPRLVIKIVPLNHP